MNGAEGVVIEPGDRVIETQVGGGMPGRKLRRECGIDLLVQVGLPEISRGDVQLLGCIGERGNAVVSGERDPDVGQANPLPDEVEKCG